MAVRVSLERFEGIDAVRPAIQLGEAAARLRRPGRAGCTWRDLRDQFVSGTAVGGFTLWLFSRGRWKTVKV
jgi:hypothetical protein